MHTYELPDSLHAFFHLIFTKWYNIDTIIALNLHMKELKPRTDLNNLNLLSKQISE